MLLFGINKTSKFKTCFFSFTLKFLFGINESLCSNNSNLEITSLYVLLKFSIIDILICLTSSKYIDVKISILFINNVYFSYIFKKFSFMYSIILIYSSLLRIFLLNLA